jgi:hypothetical protein
MKLPAVIEPGDRRFAILKSRGTHNGEKDYWTKMYGLITTDAFSESLARFFKSGVTVPASFNSRFSRPTTSAYLYAQLLCRPWHASFLESLVGGQYDNEIATTPGIMLAGSSLRITAQCLLDLVNGNLTGMHRDEISSSKKNKRAGQGTVSMVTLAADFSEEDGGYPPSAIAKSRTKKGVIYTINYDGVRNHLKSKTGSWSGFYDPVVDEDE